MQRKDFLLKVTAKTSTSAPYDNSNKRKYQIYVEVFEKSSDTNIIFRVMILILNKKKLFNNFGLAKTNCIYV